MAKMSYMQTLQTNNLITSTNAPIRPAELLAYLQGVEMGQILEQERNEQ